MTMQGRDLPTFRQVRQGLIDLGFIGDLIKADYEFADVLGEAYIVKTVPLAAFSHDPPSYQTACFGVVISNGVSGLPLVSDYKSLGAPQVFEVLPTGLRRWKIIADGDPAFQEEIPFEHINALFEAHKSDWSLLELARGKARSGFGGMQLDFLDNLLLPRLDQETQRKLDQLLRQTISVSTAEYARHEPFRQDKYPALFRLIFRLLAAKVLGDRQHPGNWLQQDATVVVEAVEGFYFGNRIREEVLQHVPTKQAAWESIRSSFHFQNLSVDALAYVYEATLVSDETRQTLGIHGTPPPIAEYLVRHLPFEDLHEDERTVFEPFAGHSVFLVAAMRRLRELLPPSFGPKERHAYFIRMLAGIEVDAFAREVGQLSLMLADYPNPNGWRILAGDAFENGHFDQQLRSANIVLCNPPFEDFTPEDRRRYLNLQSVHKPAEILWRVLQTPPRMLGFVLPKTFAVGRGYQRLHSLLAQTYRNMEFVALPDKVFLHSEAETVLLVASGKRVGEHVRVTTSKVQRESLPLFYASGVSADRMETEIDPLQRPVFDESIWSSRLREVWEYAHHLKSLRDVANIHRGIEFTASLRDVRSKLVAEDPSQKGDFVLGLDRANRIEPFMIMKTVFINISPEFQRTSAHNLPWDKPKVILNSSRRSRGPWRLTAVSDYDGLYCYTNFNGIWPTTSVPIDVLTAILNGPVANAFVSDLENERRVRVKTISKIPIPVINERQSSTIIDLVNKYKAARLKWLNGQTEARESETTCKQLVGAIDAEILKAYDLPPRLERHVLDLFWKTHRPGPVGFFGYIPPSFKPYIPWHIYISQDFAEARSSITLSRLPTIDDVEIGEALAAIGLE